MKVAVCTIARLENRYIREYVQYYHDAGIDKIYLYDNNDVDGEDLSQPIKDFIDSGFVELIDFRTGHKFVQVVLDAYIDCYRNHKNDYDWICFFDPDEYMVVNERYKSIKEYLSDKRFNRYDIIHLNWKTYDDNGLLEDDGRDLNIRFTHPSETRITLFKQNVQLKSIVRGGMSDITTFTSPHYPLVKDENAHKSCNCSGKRIPCTHKWIKSDHSLAYLKHFRCKTITEYCQNKIPKLTLSGYSNIILDDNYFFNINEWTQQKQDIFDKFFEKYIYKDYNREIIQQKDDFKFSVLTVLTGNDCRNKLYEVKNPDPNVEYICVTDRNDISSDTWKIVYDEKLSFMKTIERWKYPKFHPFEYVENDIVAYVDSSIQILGSMRELVNHIASTQYDLGLIVHPTRSNVKAEIDAWVNTRGFPLDVAKDIKDFYLNNDFDMSALFWCCMMIMKKTEYVDKINQLQFGLLKEFGCNRDVCRSDQVFYPYAVNHVLQNGVFEHIFAFNPNVICSDIMQRIKINENGKNTFFKRTHTHVYNCYRKLIKPLDKI